MVGAKDYDPEGADGSENSNETPLAIDGNPSTAWVTDHYSTAGFGRLKDGVGLWLEFGRLTQVGRVIIRSSGNQPESDRAEDPTRGWFRNTGLMAIF